MLVVRPMRQTLSHCGPFCLKMVFNYYGVLIDEKKIAKIARTTIRDGTDYLDMVKAAEYFGFNAEYKNRLSLNELRKLVVKDKVPVIINWFDLNEGHYSVVVGVDNCNIYFIDPEGGHQKKMTLRNFKRVWFSFSGDYLKSEDDLRLRPAIVIIKPKK